MLLLKMHFLRLMVFFTILERFTLRFTIENFAHPLRYINEYKYTIL